VGVVGHEVDTGSDVLLGTRGDKLHGHRVPGGGDTVSARIISAIESAVGGAGLAIWAESGIPSVTSVAVGGTGGSVQPTPVGIEDDSAASLSSATAGSTLLPGHLWVSLGSVGTDLLTVYNRERESEERSLLEHGGQSRPK